MKTTIEQIIHRREELNTLNDFRDCPIVASPGLSAEQEVQLQTAIPFPLPPSLLELLRIHDGIENFRWIDGELLSSEYIPGGSYFGPPEDAHPEDTPTWFYFIHGEDLERVAFDRETQQPDGEMEVIEVTSRGEDVRWPSLSAFLEGYLKRLERWIAEHKADLVGIDDDDD